MCHWIKMLIFRKWSELPGMAGNAVLACHFTWQSVQVRNCGQHYPPSQYWLSLTLCLGKVHYELNFPGIKEKNKAILLQNSKPLYRITFHFTPMTRPLNAGLSQGIADITGYSKSVFGVGLSLLFPLHYHSQQNGCLHSRPAWMHPFHLCAKVSLELYVWSLLFV